MKITLPKLKTRPPKYIDKEEIAMRFQETQQKIFLLQNVLFNERKKSLLIIVQGMDASGKDGVINKIFGAANPLGVKIKAFKKPGEEEERHDFLWRVYPHFPQTGEIAIHNRSYYEDIIMPLLNESLPEKIIKHRIKLLNAIEKNLALNNTKVLKFYLHISEKEQKRKIEERKSNPEKQWKYEAADNKALKKYDDYILIYERILKDCANAAPWHIIPADKKWYRNYLAANIVADALEKMCG